ncbi:class I SAM-dependent methyltransferase [Chitinophaga sancti]|uniref:class I SAM-dependent methyltransferase n=1 Tax=Chitinophaga sancti TaxID=1004 RepID=UPI003F78E119
MKNVSKYFNPTINQSVYITRNLLITNLKKHFNVLHGRMLDFGCGSKPYKTLINVDEYIGVDFQGEGHSHESEQIDVFYDGLTLPLEDNSFDSVLSTEVFEHVFNLEDIIFELHRVMKPGGTILITMPFLIAEHEAPNDCSRYTSFGLKNLLERKGFEIVYYEKLGTSVQTQGQIRMSYMDSSVLSKLNFFMLLRKLVTFGVISLMNIWVMFLNAILPKRYDAFLNHIVICKKK